MLDVIQNWLLDHGFNATLAGTLGWIAQGLVVAILAIAANYISKRILLTAVTYIIRKSKTTWDDALLEHKVFTRLSHIAPALVVYYTAWMFPYLRNILERASFVYMILTGLLVFFAFLNTVVHIYRTHPKHANRPIKGYVQVIKIVVAIFVGIFVISTMLGRNPTGILAGMGAMTAVIILVFKDSILGLVASIQLSGNDMVRIGDWIEMPKYGADGDVIDVSLHTVKVQNWDKTISTIPAYALISDSFKNWRGMSDSGGRRIKRAINIDINSITFCTPEMLARFEKFEYIRDYLKDKRKELSEYNASMKVDTTELINGRNLTNIGTFRAYVANYLKNHKKIHQDMTFLIRQLPPGEHGLPLEIYVFSNDQVWANYEAIQADIFDHLLAVVPLFDLRVFQNPTGSDFRAISQQH